jgi:hypothetical protein
MMLIVRRPPAPARHDALHHKLIITHCVMDVKSQLDFDHAQAHAHNHVVGEAGNAHRVGTRFLLPIVPA